MRKKQKSSTPYMKNAFISSMKGYNLQKFGKDLMSGLMVAIIALPLSIALGIQSGVTLQQGIITAIVAGFIVAVFGGSKHQIAGPTAAFVSIIVGYIADPEIGLLGLQMATIFAGLILIFMGLLKIGKLIRFVPYPIVIGFTTGIGITLLFGQLKDFLGLSVAINGTFVNKVGILATNFWNANLATLLVGILTLVVIVGLSKISKKIPAQFVGILVATIVTVILGAVDKNAFGVATIGSTFGDIKAEIPFMDFGSIKDLNFAKLIVPAFVIAFLGSLESLLSCAVADGLAGENHDSNMELVGQGLANVVSPMFGGLPATGAIARTAANIKNGAQSPISGIVHSVVLLLMFFLLMPVVKFIPMTGLATVLIVVAVNMANFKLFFKMAFHNIADSLILISTCLLTVFFNLVIGVGAGFAVSLVCTIPQLFNKNKSEFGKSEVTVAGCLHFINIEKFIKVLENAYGESTELVTINLENAKNIDLSAFDKLNKFIMKNDGKFAIVGKSVHNKGLHSVAGGH